MTLNETGEYINGFAFKPTDRSDEGLPIIRIQNLTKPDSIPNRTLRTVDQKYIVEPGDLLVSWSATLDVFIWEGQKALVNQHIFKVVPDEKVVGAEYLYYLLKKSIADLVKSEHLHGSTMKHINRKPFLAKRVWVPSLTDQKEISLKLQKQNDSVDSTEEKLSGIKTNIELLRQSILKAACEGRLVPTEAELAAQEGRDYETGEQLLTRILEERRKSFSGRGKYKEPSRAVGNFETPAGWVCSSLDSVVSANRPICYGILMPKENVAEGVPFVKVRDMKRDVIDIAGLHKTSHEIAQKYQRASLLPNDVLLSIRGTYGRVAMVPEVLTGGNITQDTARVSCITGISPDYIAQYLRSENSQRFFKRVARGVAVKGVNIGDVRELPVLIPPLPEQVRIVAEVERRFAILDQVEELIKTNLERCQTLRQSILHKAFSFEDLEDEEPE